MPYSPGITDQSGMLRAQGITATGNNVSQGIQQWMQNETMRRQAAGTATAEIANNPFLQQQAQANPDISALLTKVQSGNANLRDTQQLAGWASGASNAQKQTLAAQQQQAQTGLMQSQAGQAAAQAADLQSQAVQRDLQNKVLQRNMDIMGKVFDTQNPDAPLGNPAPSYAPPLTSDGMGPLTQAPTRKGTFINIIQSTGQMPDAKTVDDAYKAQYDKWAGVERPVGYVKGGQETDKDGNRLDNYFPVTTKNDGSILQSQQPLKIYAGAPPPGKLLDGQTFKPIAQNGANPSAPPTSLQPLPSPILSGESKKEIADVANDINVARQSLAVLDKMNGINSAMTQKRLAGLSAITGSPMMNNTIEPMLGDTTGQAFDSLGAKFKADVMGTARNVRNVFEYKAITGNIPTAEMTPDNRALLLGQIKTQIIQNLERNQKAMQLMQAGATPDTAWAAATDDSAKDVKVPARSQASTLMKGMTGKTKEGLPVIYDGTQWVPLK